MPAAVDPLIRNGVRTSGVPGGIPLLFAHGFGGNQDSWRAVAPEFESDYRVIVLDLAGSGVYDLSAYDRSRYDSLVGHADDVIEAIDALGLTGVTFVGHSVSSIIGVLAANQRPELFDRLILVGPSPRYIDDEASGYVGGFSQEAIAGLLDSMDSNYTAWSANLAPLLLDHADLPEVTTDLTQSIERVDPAIAAQFARATFLGDNRRDLADVKVPAFILQGAEDNIASPSVGRYVEEHIPNSRLILMNTRGHVPHLSAPDEVVRHIRAVLR